LAAETESLAGDTSAELTDEYYSFLAGRYRDAEQVLEKEVTTVSNQ
jgi:hypothetical protein